ncbi:MAG TPA: ABC transporter permease subunit, partial [Vineibacter sp.]|nr:ABC transporter permease subunit [Vineibacter sp.]
MSDIIALFFNTDIMAKTAGFLLDGLWMTLLLCLVVIPVGALGGLAVAVLAALNRRWLNIALIIYVDVFRAVPPLVLLIFVYNVPPFAGYRISEFEAVVVAFLLNTSSYYG